MSDRLAKLAGPLVILLILGAAFTFIAYHQVPEGHVGVEKNWGDVSGEMHNPGATWKMPVQDGIQNVEVRPRTYTMSATDNDGEKEGQDDSIEVLTENGVSVDVDVTVRYRVQADNASDFVTEYSTVNQAEQRLIRPSVRSRLRTEGGSIQTSEIYTKTGQQKLRQAAREVLENEFEGSGLELETVQIRRIHLPDSYAGAVEEKEIAKQNVEKKEHEVEVAERQKQKEIIEAEAEAESNEIVDESLTQDILTNRYINSLDEGDTVYVPVGNGDGLPTYLNVNNGTAQAAP